MEFSDKTLKCVICAEEFLFSAGEQMFFSEKQFQHEPKHCKRCKARLGNVRRRREASVICAECSCPTIVPFLPSEGRPVLCRACFDRAARSGSIRLGGTSSHPSQKVEAIEE
jgi:CxxC-x17-CxxC domain-containing protein